jgi:hypothetical protein
LRQGHRSRAGELVKASAKLYLEAEFDADNALTELLVDTTVDALMRIPFDKSTEQRRRHTERVLDRFFSKAHAGARRRGYGHEDKRRRYHKHLAAIERALKQKQKRAPMFEHALHRIAKERDAHREGAIDVVPGPARRPREA